MSYRTNTRIIQLSPDAKDLDALQQAAEILHRGGLVAFPTETVYGLGANAFNAQAVEHIFEAKERPFSDPLIVHIASILQMYEVAETVPAIALRLAEAFWPGPLTLILRRGAKIPPTVSAGMDTVAVRFPDHKIPQELIRIAGIPIAAPSANRFSRPSPTTAQHVVEDLHGRVELILDGGPCPIGLESTVLDLLSNPPQVLRPGGLPIEIIQKILPGIEVRSRYYDAEQGGAPSPGMLLRHYSPKAHLVLFSGNPGAVCHHMRTTAQQLVDQGHKVGMMIAAEDAGCFTGLDVHLKVLGPVDHLEQIAANLFSAMRDLDNIGVDDILAGTFSLDGLGLAIRDRLLRAAEGQVINADVDLSRKDGEINV